MQQYMYINIVCGVYAISYYERLGWQRQKVFREYALYQRENLLAAHAHCCTITQRPGMAGCLAAIPIPNPNPPPWHSLVVASASARFLAFFGALLDGIGMEMPPNQSQEPSVASRDSRVCPGASSA